MPSRALWKGQLRQSLVSIPVELFSTTRSGANVSFRQIHEPSGKPVHYEKVVDGIGPVCTDDIVKGYEYESGKYVLLEPKEVDSIKLETKKTLELVGDNVVDLMSALKKSKQRQETARKTSVACAPAQIRLR